MQMKGNGFTMNGYTNERAREYKEFLKGKRATVIGAGISNIPLIGFLLSCGATVTVRDKKDRESLSQTFTEMSDYEKRGVEFILGEGYLRDIDADIVYKSPGVRFDHPEILAAYDNGAYITGEMEAFLSICPAKIIAITGSNGKTTTSTLCAKLLEEAGHTVWLGGNIGTPLLSRIDEIQPSHFVVVELSSFQLHTVNRFGNSGLPFAHITFPDSAIVTNVSPNHLDWHLSMEEYAEAKRAVFEFMREGGRFVTNADCPIASEFASSAEEKELDTVLFSGHASDRAGIYCRDGAIYRRLGRGEVKLLDTKDIIIPGLHNVENYMAAYAAVEPYVTPDVLEDVATTFKGVPYRFELCCESGGVKYFDSSIDSSPSRTEAALGAIPADKIKKVNIILGGYDKKIPFDTLGEPVCRVVRRAFICGATAKSIERAIRECDSYNPENLELVMCEDFEDAVRSACRAAEDGDYVLLSPACASFDEFRNFEERGKRFKELVRECAE